MGENAELKLSRSTILVWLSVILLLLIIVLVRDDVAVPGTFARQLLFLSGVDHLTGWGGVSGLKPRLIQPQASSSAAALGATIVLGVVVSNCVLQALLRRMLPTGSASFLGASVYALILFSAPPKVGYFSAAAYIPLLLLLVHLRSRALLIVLTTLWTATAGDLLAPLLFTVSCALFERKQSVAVRLLPLLSFIGPAVLWPNARSQLIGSVRASAEGQFAAELIGWASPDLHQHVIGVLAIAALFFVRARSERSMGTVDYYLLVAIPGYLLCASTLPFLALAVAMVVTREASDWERKDAGVRTAHWSMLSVAAVLSTILALELSRIHGAWIETEALRQLRSQIVDVQRKGPLLSDIQFGAASLAAGLSPFIDSRVEFYSSTDSRMLTGSALSDYRELVKLRPRWEEVLEHHRFRVALLPSDAPLAAVLQAKRGWLALGVSSTWDVLERGRRKSRYLTLLVAPD